MHKKISFLFIISIMLVSLVGCQTKEPNIELSAALSELTGLVELKQAGQEGFTPASADTTLEVNGQVQTGDDGRVRLDLSTGTIIRVAPSSFFTLTSNDKTDGGLLTKIKLDLGKIFIILNGGQADVETPSGVASVRGSYMKVEVDPVTKDIYITCLEGSCSASNPAGSVNFTNGQRVTLYKFDENTGTWTAPNSEPMTPEEFQEWLDNNPEAQELYQQAMGTATALAQQAETETPTEAPTETPTEEANSGNGCFNIINPPAGSSLPKEGQVTFEWEAQTGAEYYSITFVDQNGNKAVIETKDAETTLTQYIEVLPNGGTYSWFITAHGADRSELCSTTPNTFNKPQGDPLPEPPKEEPEEPSGACDPCDSTCYDPTQCGYIPGSVSLASLITIFINNIWMIHVKR